MKSRAWFFHAQGELEIICTTRNLNGEAEVRDLLGSANPE
jgi:hypothetical protein